MAGMSHKVADIAVREKFYVPMEAKTAALRSSPFEELLILSTCNRTEVYAADSREISDEELVRYVCSLAGQRPEEFSKFFYAKRGEEAARHLMNVCAGLDSVAMGEDQILHQICRAYETARRLLREAQRAPSVRQQMMKDQKETGLLSCLPRSHFQHTLFKQIPVPAGQRHQGSLPAEGCLRDGAVRQSRLRRCHRRHDEQGRGGQDLGRVHRPVRYLEGL